LGTYTNIVNFMDWSVLSIPAGFCAHGLSFGVTGISNAWYESKFVTLGKMMLQSIGERRLGSTRTMYREPWGTEPRCLGSTDKAMFPVETVCIAVVGAHLRGFPLNEDLTTRTATFVEATKTAPRYRLFALAATGAAIRKHCLQRVVRTVVAVGERDCSLQRRNQKVVEECPASYVPQETWQRMRRAAVDLAKAVSYGNVGTVEFIYDIDKGDSFFLEMNTRLQVEHSVTEEAFGLDLVKAVVQITGGQCDIRQLEYRGTVDVFAIEARIYAESPLQGFRPSIGRLLDVQFPQGARVDTWVCPGAELSSSYDPLLAKIIATGISRDSAIEKLLHALNSTSITGVETNVDYVAQAIASPGFRAGNFTTKTLDDFQYQTAAVEVVEPGPGTTVQDYPGRTGHWQVGMPPSGPMDSCSLRLANKLVGRVIQTETPDWNVPCGARGCSFTAIR
jgi:hypothetical protein